MQLERIYHPYWKWEDWNNGQFNVEKRYSEKQEEELCKKVKELLSDSKEFYKIALKVINEWVFASEHNLTNSSLNKQAWIGQASCCYKYKIPERITILGWKMLSPTQQKEANNVADKIIKIWEDNYAKKILKQKCL